MSEMKPLVSVVVRCFNRGDTVGRALESILNQTYSRLEIILIDDGSTDNSRSVAERFSGVDYYYQENKGLAGAREAGLCRAKGKYVSFLDADDFWSADFVTESVAALEQLDCDFVFSNWSTDGPGKSHQEQLELDRVSYLADFQSNTAAGWCLLSSGETRALFMRHQCGVPSATMFRREHLSLGWNLQAISADDWIMIIGLILEHGGACAFHRKKRWTRWIDGKNICEGTSDMGRRARNEIHDMQFILTHFSARLRQEEIKGFELLIGQSAFDLAHISSHEGKLLLALKYYGIAARTKSLVTIAMAVAKCPVLWLRSYFR